MLTLAILVIDLYTVLCSLGLDVVLAKKICCSALLISATLTTIMVYDLTPKARVDRLLGQVLREAGACDAQSVTFVLNEETHSLYVDIDERIVVQPCYYALTSQLARLITLKHNVKPFRLKDGQSYAYFLTPTSARA